MIFNNDDNIFHDSWKKVLNGRLDIFHCSIKYLAEEIIDLSLVNWGILQSMHTWYTVLEPVCLQLLQA